MDEAQTSDNAKKAHPLTKLSVEGRAKQFHDDFCADRGVMFCRFCDQSVDFIRVDTVKDHLKSKKQRERRKSRQVSLVS